MFSVANGRVNAVDALTSKMAVSPETAIAVVVICGLIASLIIVAQIIATASRPGNSRSRERF